MKTRFYATAVLLVTFMVATGCAQKPSYSGDIKDEEVEVVASGSVSDGTSDGDAAGTDSGRAVDADAGSDLGTAGDTQDSGDTQNSGDAQDSEFMAPATVVDDDRQADSLLDQRLVFFDFDSSLVRSEFLPVLSAHADFLVRNPGLGVILEGHADNRGSNEYNLALGQRRANAIRDILLSSGVSLGQMETLSFGEEEPRAFGNNEEAWAENRRVEIRYNDE